jgi:transcriptional regulator with XRE-family HTH domain
MWLDKLKEIKEERGMSTKQIAARSNLPDSTVKRIFMGDTDAPRVDTLRQIATSLDTTLDELFAESGSILSNKTMVALQEENDRLASDLKRTIEELDIFKQQVTSLLAEKELLREKNDALKDQIIALYDKVEALRKL